MVSETLLEEVLSVFRNSLPFPPRRHAVYSSAQLVGEGYRVEARNLSGTLFVWCAIINFYAQRLKTQCDVCRDERGVCSFREILCVQDSVHCVVWRALAHACKNMV